MGIVQLGYVGVNVSDPARWEDLATRIVGLQLGDRADDGTLHLRMDEYYHRLILHPHGNDDLAYVGWQVNTPRELDALVARLEAAGAAVTEGTAEEQAVRKVRRLVRFTDPSGHPFEAFYGPVVMTSAPFVPGRPMSGFKAGPLGVGHVVLMVDDRDETERFYLDVLGLRISDYGSGPVAFFHCNPRHHSIGIAVRGALPTTKRLRHLMLEMQNLDDVGIAYDLCQAAGVPLTITLGKHSNDFMVSFYVETPSGFALECGWGAREIDDATWEVTSYDRGDVWGHQRVPRSEPAEKTNGSRSEDRDVRRPARVARSR
jgi:2,3-dihydroxybiphenyl 1,2-dioxygenase